MLPRSPYSTLHGKQIDFFEYLVYYIFINQHCIQIYFLYKVRLFDVYRKYSSLKVFDNELGKQVIKGYHGSSQRAIIVAYKDGIKKYNEIKKNIFDFTVLFMIDK